MKKTGIKWIGNIPTDWEIKKVKHCFYISKGQAREENPTILSLARTGIKVRDISTNEGQLAASYENYNPVEPGDLLLNPMDLYSGANCNTSEVNGVISPAYVNLRAKTELNPKFFDYYFKTQYWGMAMFAHGKGVSFDNRWTINSEEILNYFVPFPSKDIQDKIVDFINRKLETIDSLIEIEFRQIDALKEYKKSYITEVIKNGLNENCIYKDSKIDWIGKTNNLAIYPRLKFCSYMKGRIGWQGLKSSDFIDDGPYCITGTDFDNGGINWETCYHVSEERYEMDPYIQIKNGDLLVTKDGTIGKLARIKNLPNKACLNSHLLIIRPLHSEYTNDYLYYVLSSNIFYKYFSKASSGAIMASISQEKMGNFSLPIYPIELQNQISIFLDQKCKEIDELIEAKQKKIDLLEEYKRTIIFEYVTGKKEVTA